MLAGALLVDNPNIKDRLSSFSIEGGGVIKLHRVTPRNL
uniref:Uncharacterized protein n=1 Tax=Peronospora matthiolae TaxID=2874970 RepID=A0AAV1UC51_9STRA